METRVQQWEAGFDEATLDSLRETAMGFAGIGWFVFDFGGVVRAMDAGAFQLLELGGHFEDPAAVTGANVSTLARYAAQGHLRSEVRARGRVRNLDWHLITLHGNEKWLAQDAFRIDDPVTGQPAIQVVLRDVTEVRRAQRALEESQARFWAASEGSLDAFYVLRAVRDAGNRLADFEFDNLNHRAEVHFGQPKEALLGARMGALFPGFPGSERFCQYAAVVESRMFLEEEYRCNLPGVAAEWVHEQVVPLGDGVAVTSKDIGARKRMEEELRAGEHRLRLLLEHAPAAVAMLDAQLRYVAYSDRWLRDFGLTGYDLTGQSHYAVFPYLSERWRQMLARVLEGETVRADAERFARPDGSLEWIRYEIVPWREHDDAVTGVVLFAENITRRVEAERSLRDSEARLRLALQSAHMGTWEWNVETGELLWSEEIEAMFGLGPGEYDGTYEAFMALVHPEDRRAVRRALAQLRRDAAGQDSYAVEFRAVRRDGKTVWMEGRGRLFRDAAGRPVRLLGATRDITAHKRGEQDRQHLELQLQHAQKLESLGVLAGGIAHDFNNLLTGVLGNVELVRGLLPEASAAQRNLAAIERSARRAADLCRQMLAYSGQGKYAVEQTNLNRLVEEMVQLIEVSVPKKSRLIRALDPGLPDLIADTAQVCQVILNLITNAAESLPAEGGDIRAETGVCLAGPADFADAVFHAVHGPGTFAFLRVSDTGHGIAPEALARIFDPFYTTKFTGRGLGLSAVLGIVRAHQGAIRIESRPGIGSTFSVYFPACAACAPLAEAPAATPPAAEGGGAVLLVDDEPSILGVVSEYLEADGFRVLTASDGHEAVELFAAQHAGIDAVVLDLTMPRKGGEEAFREMRAIDPAVPIILASGYGEDNVVALFRDAPLAGFLQKPYQGSELAARLRKIIAARR